MCSLSDETKLKLHHVTEDRDKLKKEKEEQYQTLMQKIKSVEQAYESILQVGSLPYSIVAGAVRSLVFTSPSATLYVLCTCDLRIVVGLMPS